MFCNRVYKPGSVLNGHLSSLVVTNKLRDFSRATLQIRVGQTSAFGVASSRVYSGSMLPQKRVSSYLAFPSLPRLLQRAQTEFILRGKNSPRRLFVLTYPYTPCDLRRVFCILYNNRGGLFLLHFPAGRPGRTLSVILLCDARTFLTVIPFGTIPRDCPAQSRILYIIFPPMSSVVN